MALEQAKIFLNKCNRFELRDHAFGDSEVEWFYNVVQVRDHAFGDSEVEWFHNVVQVANGYFGGSSAHVTIYRAEKIEIIGEFEGLEARELRECGTLVQSTRNNETGPEEYTEGQIMPGLTKEAVWKEITEPEEA